MNKKAYSIGSKQFDAWLKKYFDTWYMTDRQYSHILDELAYLRCYDSGGYTIGFEMTSGYNNR